MTAERVIMAPGIADAGAPVSNLGGPPAQASDGGWIDGGATARMDGKEAGRPTCGLSSRKACVEVSNGSSAR